MLSSALTTTNYDYFPSTDDTAADSTQDPHTKETKKTFPAETSSIEQAESSSPAREKDSNQVGSTDNGVSTATKHQKAEMTPESSSEAQEKVTVPVVSSMEAESSSASSVEPTTLVKPAEQVNVAFL